MERAVAGAGRPRGPPRAAALKLRRTKTKKAKIGVVRAGGVQSAKGAIAPEKFIEICRQVAGKGRDLGLAVEAFAGGDFAGGGGAEYRRQLVAPALHLR